MNNHVTSYNLYRIIIYLPAQRCVLHALMYALFPAHPAPPPFGVGLLQCLILRLIPPLQLRVHVLYAPQAPQLPFTLQSCVLHAASIMGLPAHFAPLSDGAGLLHALYFR